MEYLIYLVALFTLSAGFYEVYKGFKVPQELHPNIKNANFSTLGTVAIWFGVGLVLL